jgi:hypothetical protein
MTGTGVSTADSVAGYGVATSGVRVGIGIGDELLNKATKSLNAGFGDCTLEDVPQENGVGDRTDLASGGGGDWTRIVGVRLPSPLLILSSA